MGQIGEESPSTLEIPDGSEAMPLPMPGQVFMCAICNKVMLTFEEAQQHAQEEHKAEALAMEEGSLQLVPDGAEATAHVVMGTTDAQLLELGVDPLCTQPATDTLQY